GCFRAPTEIRDGVPSIAGEIARRKRWWIRQGYRKLKDISSPPLVRSSEHTTAEGTVDRLRSVAASDAPSSDGSSPTSGETYHARWHFLGANVWAEGKYRNVVGELAAAIGFTPLSRAVDAWLDVVREVKLDEYPSTRTDPWQPVDDGTRIDEIHSVSHYV